MRTLLSYYGGKRRLAKTILGLSQSIVFIASRYPANRTIFRKEPVSLHSRRRRRHAEIIYQNPEMFDRSKRAGSLDAGELFLRTYA
ncbi:MAG: hypothetical protein LBG43_02450 [Treponema sp.]|jgi:hypothetical protein|nr:hypothetical protein [Treponema sp.]